MPMFGGVQMLRGIIASLSALVGRRRRSLATKHQGSRKFRVERKINGRNAITWPVTTEQSNWR
jgi:hypothetical protein